jgi:hypothetical protein
MLGVPDKVLNITVIEEEAVFVTNDEADFAALYQRVDLHTGLLILPQAETREALWHLLDAGLHYIEQQASVERETAAEWMLNKRVDVAFDGAVTHLDFAGTE